MRNPTGKKLEKIIFKLFDDASQGVDRYNHNNSLWLIFTNEMRWVVEYTKDQTLWYNYNFFKDEMELIGLNCVEDKDLIKKWFESRFLGIPKVEDAFDPFFDQDQYVEDAIENGVKDTRRTIISQDQYVEDTIKNGVKDIRRTRLINLSANQMVEDAIQNGVKYTYVVEGQRQLPVEDTIQNGVKHTLCCPNWNGDSVEDTIQNGVKQTELSKRDFFPKDIIQDGLKINGTYVGGKRQKENVEVVIDYGVKETYDDCSNNIARVEGIVRIGEKLN